jgi:hypothetical protein
MNHPFMPPGEKKEKKKGEPPDPADFTSHFGISAPLKLLDSPGPIYLKSAINSTGIQRA